METAGAITVKDVADLLFAARGRIDFYWNFHVVVVIAVIGWLLSSAWQRLRRSAIPACSSSNTYLVQGTGAIGIHLVLGATILLVVWLARLQPGDKNAEWPNLLR